MRFFVAFSVGMASVSAFTFTARSSPVFLGGRERGRKPCGIFNCGPERHFSIPAEELIFGNGSSGFSTLK
jgi:hypothetical protein